MIQGIGIFERFIILKPASLVALMTFYNKSAFL